MSWLTDFQDATIGTKTGEIGYKTIEFIYDNLFLPLEGNVVYLPEQPPAVFDSNYSCNSIDFYAKWTNESVVQKTLLGKIKLTYKTTDYLSLEMSFTHWWEGPQKLPFNLFQLGKYLSTFMHPLTEDEVQ